MKSKNIFMGPQVIDDHETVSDIVKRDYRTADVFRKYGIDYCCGGKISLQKACEMRDIDTGDITPDLLESMRSVSIGSNLFFNEWDIDFLADYIINVHHAYLVNNLPLLRDDLERFVQGHRKKYPFLDEVQKLFEQLSKHLIPHLQQEEEIIFPYIRQIAHAYNGQEPYARLLVRTLRKPVEDVMHHEHALFEKLLNRLRTITHNYAFPHDACTAHRVVFLKLKELDNDIVQHVHLENNILFPRAIAMEKELLQKQD
jgi:regulator of cell morphogenesis and NO signaling